MSKKILSIVLSVVMLMGILVVGVSAVTITDYKKAVQWSLVGASIGSTTKESTYFNTLATYESKDPQVFERNILFWDDAVIAAYRKAETSDSQADWKAVYDLMRDGWAEVEGEEQEDYYSIHRYTHKATVEAKYTTDVAYAKVGETINVTLSLKTNFYASSYQVGVMYDKTKVELVPGSAAAVTDDEWMQKTVIENYGFANTGKDMRNTAWPAQYRDLTTDEKDKIGMVKVVSGYDTLAAASGAPYARLLAEFTPVATFQFKVKTGVSDGTTIDFYATEDCVPYLDDLYFLADNGSQNLFTIPRVISPVINQWPDEVADFDHDWTFTTATVTVGEEVTTLPADYTALDAAIAEKATLTETDYTAASWAVYAQKVADGQAVSRDLTEDDQAIVDAATKAITDAKAALKAPANYTELDAAIAQIDELNENDYKPATWAAYKAKVDAGKAVSRDLTSDDQAIIDNAAAAIDVSVLEYNEVVSAAVTGSPVIGSNANVDVTVTGSPLFITLADEAGTFLTFTSENATIKKNGNGTETWTIKVFAADESADYEVFAKYDSFTTEGVEFTVNAEAGLDLSIHSITVMDMYPNNQNGGSIVKGKHTIIITTSTDVSMIQFVDPKGKIESGSTYTYTLANPTHNCSYTDKDGERTWTITHSFGPMGTWSMPIRTRAESTTFATTGDYLTARVVY